MTKSKTRQQNPEQKSPNLAGRENGPPSAARPGGKLGMIIDQLATEPGATADELATATGWQRHTVLGALSRLRSRGFAMDLQNRDGKKSYRLPRAEG